MLKLNHSHLVDLSSVSLHPNWPIILTVISLLMLLACSKQKVLPKVTKIYVVKKSTVHKALHFSGMIQPIKEYEITTPMTAVVKNAHYQYGQALEKDQIVFTLVSMALQRQYQEKLTNYLKSKDRYSMLRSKFHGTETLWKEGLESRNNYLNEQSTLAIARIAFIQDLAELSDLIAKTAKGESQDFTKLSFTEFDKVRLALNSQHNIITLKSPHPGILLYPPSDDSTKTRMNPGRTVKANQVLGLIGDLSGIRIEIAVPEIDISDIKIGMPAIIRGIAFGRQELHGSIVAINAQASANSEGLPSFMAVIEVRKLTADQQIWIKVGMSAEIELIIKNMDKLIVPTAAIRSKTGQTWVTVKAPNGKMSPRSVVTGRVDSNKVIISSGLSVGDQVIYD